MCWTGFEDLRPKAASPRGTPREGSGSLSLLMVSIVVVVKSRGTPRERSGSLSLLMVSIVVVVKSRGHHVKVQDRCLC